MQQSLSQYQSVGDTDQPEEFQKLLRAVLRLEPRAVIAAERDPFIGLQAYDSRRAHLFFGREQEINELVALLRQTPFVVVTGDSGSGKSSLVLAGLVPAFCGGRLGRPPEEGPDETIWHVIETRPGSDPFGRLADSVRAAAERTGTWPLKASQLAKLVRKRQPDGVRDAVLSGVPKDPQRPSRVLLVVDQFEEFRTSPDAAAYVTTLLSLATPGDDQIRVVLTMRRDYYYICRSFPDFRERLQGSTPSLRYLLGHMSRGGLCASITKPLELAGIDQRDREDLARAVLKDVGDEPGELALLQMALWRTWSEAKGRGPYLVRAYDTIGRVEGALAQAAEDVFKRLTADEQQRAETLFVRLVHPGEAGGATRRMARLNEFDGPIRVLADKLSQQEQWRLLTIGEHTVEIAHEQLATQWLRYQRWIANVPGDPEYGVPPDPRGDDLRLLQLLIAAAARWEMAPSKEKARCRATGVDLELYQQLANRRTAWLLEIERQFVADSIKADLKGQRIRRLQRWIGVLFLALVPLVGALIWMNQRNLTGKHATAMLLSVIGLYPINSPEMVDIEPGEFWMGLRPEQLNANVRDNKMVSARPLHKVSIQRPFKIGRYEITYKEFLRFAYATGRTGVLLPWTPPGLKENETPDERPVAYVSWTDAVEYAKWLSAHTHQTYRLPTEAEWEYVARAGTDSTRFWGDDPREACKYANIADEGHGTAFEETQTHHCNDGAMHTTNKGKFEKNAFKVYDIIGNVWEWVADCADKDYNSTPHDGSAWREHDEICERRVIRGGSYSNDPSKANSIYRGTYRDYHQQREAFVGFRLVQQID